MSRLRQTNQQKAGKQNTSKSISAYYGSPVRPNGPAKKKRK